jgi:ectoine hydroxylase-related dioxygenase (phytanoyl-CoA dioxygenase family)
MSLSYKYEAYVCTKETLKKTLDKYGVAIIPNVLTDQECDDMVSGMWDFFEHITQDWAGNKTNKKPINRNDKSTWREFYNLFPSHSMLIQHWNVGHAQVSWDLRQKEKIVDIFAHFWKCNKEELLTSFDGLSFNFPPEETKRGHFRGNTWYHCDQSFTRQQFECVQSWITGLDVEKDDATLTIYEGSHKYQNEFAETFDVKDKSDWYKLSNEEELFYIQKGCERVNIMCPKGSMVFWDSRTIHCGTEARKNRPNKKFRSVVYLCYQPRSQITPALLRKKIKAFNELRTTNHWPSKPKLFAKNPRTYGKELPIINPIRPPVLTELGKKLAGF